MLTYMIVASLIIIVIAIINVGKNPDKSFSTVLMVVIILLFVVGLPSTHHTNRVEIEEVSGKGIVLDDVAVIIADGKPEFTYKTYDIRHRRKIEKNKFKVMKHEHYNIWNQESAETKYFVIYK